MGTLQITNFSSVLSVVGGRSGPTGGEPGWYELIQDGINPPIVDSSDAALLNCLLGPLVTPGPGTIRLDVASSASVPSDVSISFGFDFNATIFSLDGNPPVNFNNLPPGFVITELTLSFDSYGMTQAGADNGTIEIASQIVIIPPADLVTIFNLSFDLVTLLDPVLLPFTFIGYNCKITGQNFTGIEGAGILTLSNLIISGTYAIASFTWTIDTVTPVGPGNTVQVTSLSINGLNFGGCVSFSLQYIDSNGDIQTIPIPAGNIVTQTAHLLEFITPDFIPDAPSLTFTLIAVGDGTQFSGSLSLGTLTILYTNGSGLYRIVKDKSSDTIYDRSTGLTAEIRIPNPFAESGYIGG